MIAGSNGPSNPTALIQALKPEQAAITAPAATAQNAANTQNAANVAPPTAPAAPASAAIASLSTALNAIPAMAGTNTASAGQRTQFTQATQYVTHQGSPAPVTEAQSLPLHFDLASGGSNGSSTGQSGQHSANTSTSTASQPASATNSSTDSGPAPRPAFALAHDQNPAPQANASPPAPILPVANTAANGAAAVAQPQQPQPQQTVATLQVGPADPAASPAPNVHALAVSIAAQSQAGAKQFDIRLDPPELGRVDVRLTVDVTGKAQAHLAVDKPQTLELLQKDSGSLARALKDSGVQLNNNGLQFSLKGQGRQGDGSPRTPQRGRTLAVTAVAGAAPAAASVSASLGGVDIRV